MNVILKPTTNKKLKLIKWLQSKKLLARRVKCSRCGHNMRMERIVTHELAVFLKELIIEHHTLFKKLHNRNLIPKHQFMIHYPRLMVMFGPLSQLWCMRYEAKHNLLKRSALKIFEASWCCAEQFEISLWWLDFEQHHLCHSHCCWPYLQNWLCAASWNRQIVFGEIIHIIPQTVGRVNSDVCKNSYSEVVWW